MTGRLPARLLDWLVPLAFGLTVTLVTPWRTSLQFGQDEGFELMKAWLVSRGHSLYGAFWNDQPPLHTQLLALLFRLFGPSAWIGRLLGLGFSMLLVAALQALVRRASNRAAALLAVVLLVSSTSFIELSVSTMLEVPAFALGLASVWSWFQWEDVGTRKWVVLSGLLFSLALQVKLTSILLLPALAAAWLVSGNACRAGWRDTSELEARDGEIRRGGTLPWRAGAWWAGATATGFGLSAALFDRVGMWSVFGRSHFSSATYQGALDWDTVFHPVDLESDLGILIPAGMGLAVGVWRRRRTALFPVVALVTAVVVHLYHRPYWSYYRIHFSIPLAWLGGLGLVEGFRVLWASFPHRSHRIPPGLVGGYLAWSTAVASAVALIPEKTLWEILRLRRTATGSEDHHVKALQAHSEDGDWIFTEDRIRAFWARRPIPPELAVIPAKRLWSGQLPSSEVRRCLDRYRPRLIFLSEASIERFRLGDYLAAHYAAVPNEPGLFRLR